MSMSGSGHPLIKKGSINSKFDLDFGVSSLTIPADVPETQNRINLLHELPELHPNSSIFIKRKKDILYYSTHTHLLLKVSLKG